MTSALALVALLTAWPAQAAGDASAPGTRAEPEFVPGELIVRFRPGVDAASRAEVRADGDARLQRRSSLRGVELLRLEPGGSVRAAAAELEREPEVLYAEPNFYYELQSIPNDSRFQELWGLHNTGQFVNGFFGTADADIDAPEAWDTTTGSTSVTVAVVDTGVSYDHPDLASNIWTNTGEIPGNGVDDDGNLRIDDVRGWDFVDNDNSPRDNEGHGTHVAGTIGAHGNNGQGVVGVNWRAGLMPLRTCGAAGRCDSFSVTNAFAYAGRKGTRVVNASLGSPNFSNVMLQVISDFPGTLFVAAAGNEGRNLDAPGVDAFPCEMPADNVICVAATDSRDALASFSNYGATAVDLAAPGVSVLSTLAAPDTVFSETFEGDIGATWTTGGTNNTWARTSERAKTGGFSLTDSPGAGYANATDSFARPTNAFSLAGRTECALTYEARLAVQPSDEFVIDRSGNATDWTHLVARAGTTGEAFVPFEENLAALNGQSNVFLRFRMLSDGTGTGDGVHLDDLRVRCPAVTYDAGDYEFLHGTSMATPHVSGVAALMWADTPGVSVAEVRQRLLANVDTLPSLAGRTVTAGRLNAEKAVESAPPPVVATQPASAITRATATLNGTVNPRGHATSYRFEYGTTTSYGQSTPVQDAGAGDGVVAVSAPLTGLADNTTYHYRLVATYSDGPVTTADGQFTTQAFAPLVTSQPATAIATTTAVLNGTVDPRRASTTYHFEYGPTTDYDNSTPVVDAGSGSGPVTVSAPLTLLEAGTTYHFRLVATSAGGTTAGEDLQFTTAPLGVPVAAVAPPTAVLRTGATLNGTVDPAGRQTFYRFQYGTTTGYGSSTPVTDAGSGTGPVAVTAPLTGLAPGTTYHFRIVAQNADAVAITEDAQFTTPAVGPPVVAVAAPTPIGKRSATLRGTLDPRGVATTYHFEYGTTTSYGSSTPASSAEVGSGQLPVGAPVSGLAPSTTYHFRLVATSADGTSRSDDGQFTTAPLAPPVVAPEAATLLAKRSATVNGTVNPRGLATTYRFEYGTTTAYGSSTQVADAGDGSGPVPVSAALSGLVPGTTYHFRLVATNADGTSTSGDAELTTLPPTPPVLAPGDATTIAKRSATLNGTVIPRGSATTYHFEYGKTTGYGSSTSPADAGDGAGQVAVSAALSGLDPGTTYHFRLVATNADGSSSSEDAEFTTLPLTPPSIVLGEAVAGKRGATVGGTVNPGGLATEYHFEYRTATNDFQSTPIVDAGGDVPVAVSADLTGLAPNTTYDFRLVATNADGTTSEEGEFTTLPLTPPAVTLGTVVADKRDATVAGTVNPRGLDTEYHFEYGTATDDDESTTVVDAGDGDQPVAVHADLTGLEPGTTYHFRLVATSEDGTTQGDDGEFATLPLTPPSIALGEAVAGKRGATLNGTVNPRGSATEYRFEYGKTTNYGSSTSPVDAGDGSEPEPVSAALSGLAPGAYHFRLVATSEDGTTTSGDAQFVTLPLTLPLVALRPATAITTAGATVSGTVNPRGLAATYRFEYGTTTSYGSSTPQASAGAGTGQQVVTRALSGLAHATTYHFRLVAVNEDGVTRSADGVFRTRSRPPQASTGAAAGISQTGATVGASVNPNGQATVYSFQYGRSTSYGARTPNQAAGAGRAAVAVRAALSGLEPGTAYHYRVVATNATGTVVGADRILTTAPAPPITIGPATLRPDRRGAVTIRLAFPVGTPAGTGRAELFAGRPAAIATSRLIGAKPFATRPGGTARVRIRLTRAGRRLVARRPSVTATVRVTVLTQVQTKQVRLKRRPL